MTKHKNQTKHAVGILLDDKKVLDNMRKDIEEALVEVAKKYETTMELGSSTYSEAKVIFRLIVQATGDKALKAEWDRYCKLYGFKSEDFGKTSMFKGEEIKLVGFDNSRPKYCVRFMITKTGEERLYTREVAKRVFKIKV